MRWRLLVFEAENFARDRSNTLSKAMTEAGERRLNWLNEAWAKRYGDGWAKVKALVDASREHWKREAEKEEANRQKEIDNERLRAEAAEQSRAAISNLRAEPTESPRSSPRRARSAAGWLSALASSARLIVIAAFAIWSHRIKEDIYRWRT